MSTLASIAEAIVDCEHKTAPEGDGYALSVGTRAMKEGRIVLDACKRVSEDTYVTWTRRMRPIEGDLILAREAPVGQVVRVPDDPRVCLGQRTVMIRPDRSAVHPRFLHYWLLGPDAQHAMNSVAAGATVPHLNVADIRNLDVSRMPRDLGQQAMAAEVLGSIDDLIENNRRRVAVLEEIARAIYREWFVHFRYPGHDDVPLVDSPLGPIPDGWEALTVGDVLELRYGKALKKDDRRGGPVAVVSSAGVVGWHDEPLVAGPTIVVGRKGNVGSVTWVDGDAWPIDTAYFVDSELPLRYVAEQLRGTEFLNTHAAVPGLSRDQAYSRPFLRPTVNVMQAFDVAAGTLASEARAITGASERLSDLRNLLLPKLVADEILTEAKNRSAWKRYNDEERAIVVAAIATSASPYLSRSGSRVRSGHWPRSSASSTARRPGPGSSAMKRPPRSAFPERPVQMTQSTKQVPSSEARSKPVRVTVDLDLEDYDALREFAFTARMTHADVLRSLVRLLACQPISDQVRKAPEAARAGVR